MQPLESLAWRPPACDLTCSLLNNKANPLTPPSRGVQSKDAEQRCHSRLDQASFSCTHLCYQQRDHGVHLGIVAAFDPLDF